MGATTFMTVGKGADAKEAFKLAVEDAQYEHGHGGYSGTIAEKTEFKMVRLPFAPAPDATPREVRKLYSDYADKLTMEDKQIADKWGPAGCIDLGEGEYLFFGWAAE